jgi:hypothetical protein
VDNVGNGGSVWFAEKKAYSQHKNSLSLMILKKKLIIFAPSLNINNY